MKASRLRVGTAVISSAAVAAFGLSIFTPALSAQNVTPPPGAVVNTIKIKGPDRGAFASAGRRRLPRAAI